MDVLVTQARRSVFIIGVNLEGAPQGLPALIELARAGGTVRLLASDPYGTSLASAATMSGIDPERRRQKIIQNLQLLYAGLAGRLAADDRARVSVMITDRFLPVGAVGLDERTRHGSLIVQHYLTDTPADAHMHTRFHATLLATAALRGPGMALDLGAGEGADAIRLAKLGYEVEAIDVSAVACEKIVRFAQSQGVQVTVRNEPLETVKLSRAAYDLVLMNGCLHYVRDKIHVLRRVLAASTADAVHAVALFSTVTPVPAEHSAVPVFPDNEGGVVEGFYRDWKVLLRAREHARSEHSHPGFAPHVHSHIKLIAARTAT